MYSINRKTKKLQGLVLVHTRIISLLVAIATTAMSANYYVATTGNDGANGSFATPFKTIQKAADLLAAGDVCYVRAGTYRESVVVPPSGTQTAPIVIQAYTNEHPIISALEPIADNTWTVHSGHIYKTQLGWSLGHENQVFANSIVMWNARWPNIASFGMSQVAGAMAKVNNASETTISDPAIPGSDGDWIGATVWCRTGSFGGGLGAWLAQTSVVTAYSATNHQLTFPHFTNNDPEYALPTANNDYFLCNNLKLLDSQSEWYVDANNVLYFWAPNGISPVNVEVKKRISVIDISNRSYIEIRGISTLGGTIAMSGANNCTLDSLMCNWLYSSYQGINSYNSQSDKGIVMNGNGNVVRNSEIGFMTGTGINISGSNNTIENNFIHDANYISSYAAIIGLAGTNNKILRNTLSYAGRTIINHNGSGTNEIAYNDMHHFMMLSADGGATYAYHLDGKNTVYHHNWLHDATAYDFNGFYPDNACLNFIFHHNVIWNLPGNAIKTNLPATGHQIYNNTFWNCNNSMGAWGPGGAGDTVSNVKVYNNLIANCNNSSLIGTDFKRNIITATPGFVNPAALDFRLSTGSVAIDTGVVIPGYTDGYIGRAPDAGAYEYGAPAWYAGKNSDIPMVEIPSISPANGMVLTTDSVRLSCLTANVQMYYTINGTDPTQSSALYTGPITLSGTNNSTITFKARAFKNGIQPSPIAAVTYLLLVPRYPDSVSNLINGLSYKYYEGTWTTIPNFQPLTPVKQGVTDRFTSTVATLSNSIGISFSGYIDVPRNGIYTFSTTSDDGSKLYIGNTVVVNNDSVHALSFQQRSGIIALKAGKHAIIVDYFNNAAGSRYLVVWWAGPGFAQVAIPGSQLYYSASTSTQQRPFYRTLKTGIRKIANGFIVSVGDKGKHHILVLDQLGRAVRSMSGIGNAQYSILNKDLSMGVYTVFVASGAVERHYKMVVIN